MAAEPASEGDLDVKPEFFIEARDCLRLFAGISISTRRKPARARGASAVGKWLRNCDGRQVLFCR
jgi:hypothetical protein